jgi:LPS sulfotransferase NodH
VLQQEAFWDIFFEYTGIKPILVLYENFAGDYQTSTVRLLERLGLPAPDAGVLSPPLKQQSDSVNDDWVRRYSDIKLAAEFDLIPALTPASSDIVEWTG